MFLAVVKKWNSIIGLLHTIDNHTCRVVVTLLQDGNVVNRFPVPVMYLERLPLPGKARPQRGSSDSMKVFTIDGIASV